MSTAPSLAQEQPPTRVGRVSFVEGQLAFHTAGETSWSAASVNYPVATGGSFWVDPKSRAEIRIGAQTIGLTGNTEIDVVKLDEQVMQLAVPQGRIELQLRQLGEGNTVEIDIPRGGVWLLQPGIYDIDAGNAEQPSRITALAGRARFIGGSVDVAINNGEAAVISGADKTLAAALEHAAPDAFAEWCRSRAYNQQRLASPYFVSPRMTGYEELDQYGAWRSVPEYGDVWYPGGVAADWTPYSNGSWLWMAPWGWNWVGAEPWGFAPYHYGRWAYAGGAWGWVPGSFVASPVYAPALVAFVANPAVVLAAAVAGPLVGWFPLGPGEAYWPGYSSDPSYIRAINTGVVRDPGHLGPRPNGGMQTAGMNFANRHAATVVSARNFAGARGVAGHTLRVSEAGLQHARVTAQGPAAAGLHGGRGIATNGGRSTAHGGAGAHGASSAGFRGGNQSYHGGGHASYHGGGGIHGGAHAGHGGGYAAFHGGGHGGGGGGPHFSGGGMPHFGGGGGGPHGGGGAGPHGGGGHGGGGGGHGGGGGGKGH
jgi:hypothetical protein